MDDLLCPVCNALVTPVGQADGVFCTHLDCPGERLCRFDVSNVCEPHPFCLNFNGEMVAVKADAAAPPPAPAVTVVKKKGKKLTSASATGPDLFGDVS